MLFRSHTAPHKTIDDVFKHEMIVGGPGPATDPELFPRAMNKVFGTRFKVVSGYKGMAQLVLAMEREEVQGIGNWSFSDIEKGRADWVTEKKIRILLQLGISRSASPLLRDVPLIADIARDDEQRSVFNILLGMKAMGRPYFVAPGVPAVQTDALRSAFMATMRDPEFLAEAARTLGQIDPLTGPEMQELIRDVYALPPEVIAKAREIVKVSGAN